MRLSMITFLIHKVTSKQNDDNNKFFQVMMDKSQFNHNKAALKIQDSLQPFQSHKRKRNNEDMLLHKKEHNKQMSEFTFTKMIESKIKNPTVLENYITKVKELKMIYEQNRTNNK